MLQIVHGSPYHPVKKMIPILLGSVRVWTARLWTIVALLVSGSVGFPAASLAQGSLVQGGGADAQESLYQACLNQARGEPEAGYRAALDWHAAGGGLPARHCAAVALLGLRAYEEAASRLETLAAEVPDARLDLRLGLIAQAAQGWMMSGRPARAEHLLSLVVGAVPDDPQILADRAVARLALNDHWSAIDDLDRALQIVPRDVELLLYRASAYRYLGVPDLARDDVDRALAVDSRAPGAWLERGILDRMAGDDAAARRSWIKVLEVAPESPAADAARARLEALDLGR